VGPGSPASYSPARAFGRVATCGTHGPVPLQRREPKVAPTHGPARPVIYCTHLSLTMGRPRLGDLLPQQNSEHGAAARMLRTGQIHTCGTIKVCGRCFSSPPNSRKHLSKRTIGLGQGRRTHYGPSHTKNKKQVRPSASLNPNHSAIQPAAAVRPSAQPAEAPSARAVHPSAEGTSSLHRLEGEPLRLCASICRPPSARPEAPSCAAATVLRPSSARPAIARRPEQRSRRAAPRLRPPPAVRSAWTEPLRDSSALSAHPPSARQPEKASSFAPPLAVRSARARAARAEHAPSTSRFQPSSCVEPYLNFFRPPPLGWAEEAEW
jgi:hypothetical protein